MKSSLRLTTLSLTLALALTACQTPGAAPDGAQLAQRWSDLRREQPRVMTRDAARKLGVSEAQLLATTVGTTATRLQDGADPARAMMRRVLDLGEITALTRNENAVIEVTGVPRRNPLPDSMKQPTGDPEKDKERALRLRNFVEGYAGGPIDLRFGFDRWQTAFAVVQPGRDGKTSRSLQFFDEYGDAVLKVYLRDDAGAAAFDKLVADFRHPQQQAAVSVRQAAARKPEKPDGAVDVKELQLAWKEITDVHQFARLMTEFGVTREQALRLAPAGTAQRLTPAAVRSLLDGAAAQQIALMAFVGNRGVTQIFSGKIQKVAASGDWYNVLDPAFNLHLRDKAFARGWLIERAGVRSVEFYDDQGEPTVSFFGVRERGQPQPAEWVRLLDGLPRG